jgi:hypothetical protein
MKRCLRGLVFATVVSTIALSCGISRPACAASDSAGGPGSISSPADPARDDVSLSGPSSDNSTDGSSGASWVAVPAGKGSVPDSRPGASTVEARSFEGLSTTSVDVGSHGTGSRAARIDNSPEEAGARSGCRTGPVSTGTLGCFDNGPIPTVGAIQTNAIVALPDAVSLSAPAPILRTRKRGVTTGSDGSTSGTPAMPSLAAPPSVQQPPAPGIAGAPGNQPAPGNATLDASSAGVINSTSGPNLR